MRTRRACITLAFGSLDDDVNGFLGRLVWKDISNIVCWVEFTLVRVSDLVELDATVVAGDRDGDLPEGELIGGDIIQPR